jgi:hypothetical protein
LIVCNKEFSGISEIILYLCLLYLLCIFSKESDEFDDCEEVDDCGEVDDNFEEVDDIAEVDDTAIKVNQTAVTHNKPTQSVTTDSQR